MHTDTESEYKDWIFGAVVTVLIVACFAWIYGYSDAPGQASGFAPARSVTQVAGTTSPSSSRTVSRRAARQDNSIAEVYECEEDGHRIFSDQPCGPSANVLKVMAPNRMDAQDTIGSYQDSRPRGSYST